MQVRLYTGVKKARRLLKHLCDSGVVFQTLTITIIIPVPLKPIHTSPTDANKRKQTHSSWVCLISVTPLGICWHLFSPTEQVKSAIVGSWNVWEVTHCIQSATNAVWIGIKTNNWLWRLDKWKTWVWGRIHRQEYIFLKIILKAQSLF